LRHDSASTSASILPVFEIQTDPKIALSGAFGGAGSRAQGSAASAQARSLVSRPCEFHTSGTGAGSYEEIVLLSPMKKVILDMAITFRQGALTAVS